MLHVHWHPPTRRLVWAANSLLCSVHLCFSPASPLMRLDAVCILCLQRSASSSSVWWQRRADKKVSGPRFNFHSQQRLSGGGRSSWSRQSKKKRKLVNCTQELPSQNLIRNWTILPAASFGCVLCKPEGWWFCPNWSLLLCFCTILWYIYTDFFFLFNFYRLLISAEWISSWNKLKCLQHLRLIKKACHCLIAIITISFISTSWYIILMHNIAKSAGAVRVLNIRVSLFIQSLAPGDERLSVLMTKL